MVPLTEAIVVLPDFQVPLHDERKILRVFNFIKEFKPAKVAHVGDFTDSTQISRWVRGMRGEFDGGLEGGFAKSRDLLANLRRGYDGPVHLSRSNHDDRMELAIEQRLPGIAAITVGGQVINIQNALRLDDFGVTWHPEPYELAPGVLIMHGDEGGLSSIPGWTAGKLAEAAGMSVVCGHTHRSGLARFSKGVGSRRKTYFGMEVGHLMRVDRADYLGPAKFNNWSNAFGILWVHREGAKQKATVVPQLIPIEPDGAFYVDGVKF